MINRIHTYISKFLKYECTIPRKVTHMGYDFIVTDKEGKQFNVKVTEL